MLIDKWEQQPNEKRLREIDYSAWLSSDEEMTNVTVATELYSGETDDTSNPFVITLVGVILAGKSVSYYAEGGADGNTYKATFSIDTDFGQEREDEILFKIKEV